MVPLAISLTSCGGDLDDHAVASAASTVEAASFSGMRPQPSSAPSSASDPPPSYHGGATLANVDVNVVYWGSNVASVATSNIPGFYTTVTDSNYIDWLDEYFSGAATVGPIGRGDLRSATTITPGHTATTLSQSDVNSELASQINAGHLSAPNANTLYAIYFPPGVHINNVSGCGNSCTDWWGCHGWTTQTVAGQTSTFAYALIPDLGPSGCGGAGDLATLTEVSSHELAEAITDPFGNGWFDEIGDLCAWQPATFTSSGGTTYTVQKLWSNKQNACVSSISDCQRISDSYGVTANVTWGFAPPEVQSWWTANGCNTAPQASGDLCEKMSEIFGTTANMTWGYAPATAQQFWQARGCSTSPLVSEPLCQRASDTYGIIANFSWGSAPSSVRTWWVNNQCSTRPHVFNSCQKFADRYGTIAGATWGFAPNDVHAWWSSNNCNAATTTSVAQLCQNASNEFGIVANVTFGGAPTEVQQWWIANQCNASPSCQEVSDLFGIFAGQSWGSAPSYVQTWWTGNNCQASPLFSGDACQLAADTYGIVANNTFGFARSFVQSWWTGNNCNAHPRSDGLRALNNGN